MEIQTINTTHIKSDETEQEDLYMIINIFISNAPSDGTNGADRRFELAHMLIDNLSQ